jgi:sugar (pentulose or hexulose) kinase
MTDRNDSAQPGRRRSSDTDMPVCVGIDIGTSACRACAVDSGGAVVAGSRVELPDPERAAAAIQQDPAVWWNALCASIDALCRRLDPQRIRRVAVDGTSATVLLCRADGTPLTPALMYNDARAVREAELIATLAPPDSAARGAASSLAKCLHLSKTCTITPCLALHQADWLAGGLTGDYGSSDENNALKLGYDVLLRRWPAWFEALPLQRVQLPRVVAPGTPLGTLRASLAARWGLGRDVTVVAGTTDSTAGFIAAGADRVGTAVTALGSTLVLKVLSERPVWAARYGVYSHRLADRWLVGGASNAGGSVLRSLFGSCDIKRFTRLMQPWRSTGLDYYPLPARGERFPLNDPELQPRLQPRPASDAVFFQAILEGLANIEQRGYRLLSELGAPYPAQVLSVGGGAVNRGWQQIRARRLRVPVRRAAQQEAAYGSALLALRGQAVFPDP